MVHVHGELLQKALLKSESTNRSAASRLCLLSSDGFCRMHDGFEKCI